VHILIATDADYVVNEVTAALGGPDVRFTVCRNGRAVVGVVKKSLPDLAVLDLQIGSMGAMAVTMDLRLDESAERLPRAKVLMLLDRAADVHLAKRCDADAWLIKPLSPLALKRAARSILNPPSPVEPPASPAGDFANAEIAEEEAAAHG
jgi:DNA-binding response OmpR family regulator